LRDELRRIASVIGRCEGAQALVDAAADLEELSALLHAIGRRQMRIGQ
jgi:hypothetical protein